MLFLSEKSPGILKQDVMLMVLHVAENINLLLFSYNIFISSRVGHVQQMKLFYLPTQIRFLIRGEHVACIGSKHTNSLGCTKLT